MEDWAEVHRLFHREGRAKAAIARWFGMSRKTVDRLLGLTEPQRYVRAAQCSQLDPSPDAIAAMLARDPTVRATVIREHLRADGHGGGLAIPQGAPGEDPAGFPGRPSVPTDGDASIAAPRRGARAREGPALEPILGRTSSAAANVSRVQPRPARQAGRTSVR